MPVQILLVHRAETSRRRVRNEAALLAALQALPGVVATEFVGQQHSQRDSFKLFHQADVVVGPHGAAFAFAQAMRPGTALVELSMLDGRANTHHTYDFFRLLARRLGLHYGLVASNGSAFSELDVDPAAAASTVALLLPRLGTTALPPRP